jgi:ABC-type transporter Mla subunit MlaD
VLIIIFIFLLTYQFYSGDIKEGIDQGEIEKINNRLQQLIYEVKEATSGKNIQQLHSNVSTLQNDMKFFNDNRNNINEMILQSNEIFSSVNDAKNSVEYEDDGDTNEMAVVAGSAMAVNAGSNAIAESNEKEESKGIGKKDKKKPKGFGKKKK